MHNQFDFEGSEWVIQLLMWLRQWKNRVRQPFTCNAWYTLFLCKHGENILPLGYFFAEHGVGGLPQPSKSMERNQYFKLSLTATIFCATSLEKKFRRNRSWCMVIIIPNNNDNNNNTLKSRIYFYDRLCTTLVCQYLWNLCFLSQASISRCRKWCQILMTMLKSDEHMKHWLLLLYHNENCQHFAS